MRALNRPIYPAFLCIVLGLGLGAYWVYRSASKTPEQENAVEVPPLPPVSSVPFLNTKANVKFVGQQTCAGCHVEVGESYQKTAHAQALAPVQLDEEPESTEFAVDDDRRRYRIFRKDHQLWHEEALSTSSGQELILSQYPMKWAIGSGRFSKSYLAEVDGFLVQSPATWYRSRPGWALSPGYDRYNSSFERTTELRCIRCHVGRVEPRDQSFHRLTIHTQAIDCERCHGPGSLHVALRNEKPELAGEDLTIVHPGRLDREHGEAICAQCHLHAAATVELRGRRLADFRPGLALTDFAIPYSLETPGKKMEVVGHMEQMRLSRCYQESQTLTCTTCHNPHTPSAAVDPLVFRKTCLECHAVDSCGLDVAERTKQESNDQCMTCHMPKSPTDIPHFAFTHHRIGIHDPTENETGEAPDRLVALADVSQLPALDQDRNLGLAYLLVADHPEHLKHAGFYQNEARRLLVSVHNRGLRDPAVNAGLARLFWQVDADRTMNYAKAVLDSPEATPDERSTALFTLATTHLQRDELPEAAPFLEELVRVRRYADAWHALSLCREAEGDWEGAIAASVKAAEISPIRPDFQQRLVELYEQTKRPQLAARHRQQFNQLKLYHQHHP